MQLRCPGLPKRLSGKRICLQCRRCGRHRLEPCVSKAPWRRNWQPTPVFPPGKPHGRRSLVGCRQRAPQSLMRLSAEQMACLLGSPSGLPRLGSFSWLPQPPVPFSAETLAASLFATVPCDVVFSPSLYWSESATWVRCVAKPRCIFPICISVPAKSLPCTGPLRASSRCPELIFPVIRHGSKSASFGGNSPGH